MRAVVTGAAGFIGFALSRRLLSEGFRVIGVDSFLDSYPREVKEDRLKVLRARDRFEFFKQDLAVGDLSAIFAGVDYVFHSPDITAVHAVVGRNGGSDHRPVIVELHL